MFNVYVYNEGDALPADDICYLIAKDGILLKKKVGLLESLAPVDKISILGDLKPTAKLHIEKIPGLAFAKIYSFFKAVYNEHYSECIALLFYNPKTKKYKTYIPNQEVSGASLDYVKDRTFNDHMLMGSIHSHAGMSAFHSGTDKDDEVHWDGLHITLGKMNQDILDISASIVANGSRFIIDPLDYIENVELVEYTPYHPTHFRPGFTVIDGEKQYNKDVKSYLGYGIVGLSEKEKDFDKNWMRFVKKKTYQYQGGGYSKWVWDNELKKLVEVKVERGTETVGSVLDIQRGSRGYSYGYGMGSGFGENWWDKRNDEHTSSRGKKEYNPCRDCIFRDYKLKKEDVNLALEPVNDHSEDRTIKTVDQEMMELYDEYGIYRYW